MVEKNEIEESSEHIPQDKLIRINIKRNFKGEKGYEYTIRGDTIEEIQALKDKAKEICEKEVLP